MTASFRDSLPFSKAARLAVGDTQMRSNLAHATTTIRARRAAVIAELDDLEELRSAAAAIKDDAQSRLLELVGQLEACVLDAGGTVSFARDAAEANRIIVELVKATGEHEVVKVKSMTTVEIECNAALEAEGIEVKETDLAELIVQLGDDLPSHIVVPAIHRNRAEIRATFLAEMGKSGKPAPPDLTDSPRELAGAARAHLRDRFMGAKVAISGANFAVAESGALVVVESEGNGRMCLTLPETLISLVGIDKIIPSFTDLEVFLQLLARSATGERMNPYTSIWRGVSSGDGPSSFHLVILDNGRTKSLGNRIGRQALRCIRCAACLNVCPVYERVGGHAYGSVYPGPIGAVLAPQLDHVVSDPVAKALPFASTLCGACYEVCPVKIDIPRLLVHLRGETVANGDNSLLEGAAMAGAGWVFADARRLVWAERISALAARLFFRSGRIRRLPGPLHAWTDSRDAPLPAEESFRSWWSTTHEGGKSSRRRSRASRRSLSETAAQVARSAGRSLGAGRGNRLRLEPSGERLEGRQVVLDAIAAALARAPFEPVEVVRDYHRAGASQLTQPIELFVERLEDYRATVVRSDSAGLSKAIVEALARRGSTSLVVPPDVPREWLAALEGSQVRISRDEPPLSTAELDAIDASLTASAIGIAVTGTIILDAGKGQGRRALSLVPDHHVVVVDERDVVADVPDAISLLSSSANQTWISGPSATSDIELSRVEGVHGPRQLDVIIVEAH